MISPAPGYSGPASQPNASRKRTLFDYVELPTYRQVLKRKNSEATTRSSNKSPSIRTHTPTLSYDDYDSWETALSTPALRRARRELVQAASSKSSIKEDDRQVLSPDYPETDFAKSRYGDSPSNIGTDLVVGNVQLQFLLTSDV
jgi:hypothetical protein